jgi:imidazolonepropionase-like amidohydrolase
MALHVRGAVLPDGEVRDLWLVGDRVTYEPVADAETISDGGFVVPGLVDAHCHPGIAYGAQGVLPGGLSARAAYAAVGRG